MNAGGQKRGVYSTVSELIGTQQTQSSCLFSSFVRMFPDLARPGKLLAVRKCQLRDAAVDGVVWAMEGGWTADW